MRTIPSRLPEMRSLFALLLIAASLACGAAEPRRYAVLSLIGDRLFLSQHIPAAGERAEDNLRQDVHLEDATLEKTSLAAVDEALKRANPQSKPVLLFAQDGRIYTAQDRVLDEGGNSLHMLDYVRGLLMGQDVTHLILVTKLRQPARIQLARSVVGSGTLEGLGYYIEPTPPPDAKGQPTGVGFIAPFAYFKVTLVDLATSTIVKEERVTASNAPADAQFSTGSNPWASLPAERKVQLLQGMIRAEMARIIPRIVRQ